MTLLIPYNGFNGLVLGVTGGLGAYSPSAYSLDVYGSNIYSLSI